MGESEHKRKSVPQGLGKRMPVAKTWTQTSQVGLNFRLLKYLGANEELGGTCLSYECEI